MTRSAVGTAAANVNEAGSSQPRERSHALPYHLLIALVSILLIVWLWPIGVMLHHRDTLFPVSLHTLTEFGAIAVALLVFAVAWFAQSPGQPGNVVLIGCGFLAVGLIDLGHTMSYKGMPVFVTPADPEKAIHFWLVARYVAAFTLLAAALRERPPITSAWRRRAMLLAAFGGSALVYWVNLDRAHWWPRTFIDGQGLTPFKVVAEYGLIVVSGIAAWGFYRHGGARGGSYSNADLCTACLITILSELCFTLYANVNSVFSLLGHLYKIGAYAYIFRAIFVTSVRDPYQRLSVEVQERREAERRVEFLAYHDVLTQLPNRALARDRLVQAIADARRHHTVVALVFLDLDNFKTINDSLGHARGDALLQAVARSLVENVRESDTVCRQGGDEFLLILKGLPDVEAVGPIVSKLLEALSAPIDLDGVSLTTSASAGVAVWPSDGQDFDALLQCADTAMYRAKEEGRNGHRFFDENMNRESLERLTIRQGLRKALDAGEFLLHYQPQVDLASGEVVGFEALLRWMHPQWGLVSPARFVPVAEESGLIVPIGSWVIHEACRQAAAWERMGLPPVVMAVNLSAVQFKRGDLEAVLGAALTEAGLPAERLELELTESLLVDDPQLVRTRLLSLHAMGVKLAIDDFGTGYSSLSYLKRFPVDRLKIDRSFVSDVVSDPDDDAIVRAIIQLAASLGLRTTAEGVETEATREHLQRLGCDELQGYLVARPMPAEDVPDWLQRHVARRA
ncbi:bifunctional diguanylate cyclase/phosphodiesterase [Aquabacterium olei]|uniref:bifunctional diguanylate cyclase/phosphodiesterase n=1 Tax=Aquabacterium olei TaxID=1296669 RepID=UPI00131ED1E4|nr:EAL domain-containing protein [Aquabacterium olei]